MANVVFGNHSSVLVPLPERDRIRRFYCDVLGGEVTQADPERDLVRLGADFYIAFLYGDVPDVTEFLRYARSVWLEIKSDNVEETSRKILESGLVRKLDVPDPHLYVQTPGGQCLRLVGVDEDLSFYEGTGGGPNVTRIKEAIKNGAMKTREIAVTPNPVPSAAAPSPGGRSGRQSDSGRRFSPARTTPRSD